MLKDNIRLNVEGEINTSVEEVKNYVSRAIKEGMKDNQIIENAVNLTINVFSSKSKLLLSSVSYALFNNTIASERYKDPKSKEYLYSKEIISEINNKFVFKVPDNLSYQKSIMDVNKLLKSVAIIIVGGLIALVLDAPILVGVSAILGVLMYFVSIKFDKKRVNLNEAIDQYLDMVRNSLLNWFDGVQEYYDTRIEEIEKEMDDSQLPIT